MAQMRRRGASLYACPILTSTSRILRTSERPGERSPKAARAQNPNQEPLVPIERVISLIHVDATWTRVGNSCDALTCLSYGLIIFSFSAYYLWLTKYYMDLFEEIVSTNSKKEFQKRWTEVEQIARYQLPKAYRKRVAEVREKFGLK